MKQFFELFKNRNVVAFPIGSWNYGELIYCSFEPPGFKNDDDLLFPRFYYVE
jgi:hypothetical protein